MHPTVTEPGLALFTLGARRCIGRVGLVAGVVVVVGWRGVRWEVDIDME
jgi:hypothetical protein